MVYTSPTYVDQHTQRLINILNTGKQPIILPILPAPRATFSECFFNVEDVVKKSGGSSCFGWAILYGGSIMEAEAHAVWKNPEGKLVDITPREPRFKSKSIMFVEDPKLIFQGKLIDNRRINLTTDPLVDHIIMIFDTIGAIQIPYTKVYRGQLIQPQYVALRVLDLRKICESLFQFINNGGTLESTCFCGSGKVYRDCHGLVEQGMYDVREEIKYYLRDYHNM